MLADPRVALACGWISRLEALRETREQMERMCVAAAIVRQAHEPFERLVRAFEAVKAATDVGDTEAAAEARTYLAACIAALSTQGEDALGSLN